jgi:hypothetical protein
MVLLLALLVGLVTATPAAATERTFVFSRADFAAMIDTFNGEVLARSADFGRQLRIRPDGVKFFGRSCTSLGDGTHVISRIRVLDGADRAAQLAGKRRPNVKLGDALTSMNVAAWNPPTTTRTLAPWWFPDTSQEGAAGFAIAGFKNGDAMGTINASQVTDVIPKFLVQLDLATDVTDGPALLLIGITTDVPPSRLGKMPKRAECFVVAPVYPADLQALVDLLARTPMTDTLRTTVSGILDDASASLAANDPAAAARYAKSFAVAVAHGVGTDISGDAAEKLVVLALLVNDALGI